MIVTTTPSVEGRRITEYKGVVFGEVIAGVNFVKDFVAGLSNFFGGRSGTYEEELINARQQAWTKWSSGRPSWAPMPWWVWTLTMRSWAPITAC